VGASHLAVIGGVTTDFLRAQVTARPKLNGAGEAHPGFPGQVLAYDTAHAHLSGC